MDIIIIGAGVFGVCTALELAKRDYKVTLLESGEIPNPKAASTDISKVVRVEYGADREYFKMAAASICLLYTSPSPRDQRGSRMPSSA